MVRTFDALDCYSFHVLSLKKKVPLLLKRDLVILLFFALFQFLVYTYEFPLHFIAKVKVKEEVKVCVE